MGAHIVRALRPPAHGAPHIQRVHPPLQPPQLHHTQLNTCPSPGCPQCAPPPPPQQTQPRAGSMSLLKNNPGLSRRGRRPRGRIGCGEEFTAPPAPPPSQCLCPIWPRSAPAPASHARAWGHGLTWGLGWEGHEGVQRWGNRGAALCKITPKGAERTDGSSSPRTPLSPLSDTATPQCQPAS